MIGSLRHRLLLQHPQTHIKDGGGHETIWQDDCTIWAKIMPLRGKEIFYAMGAQNKMTHRITLRYRAGIKPQMRFVYKERVFKIVALVNENESDRYMTAYCDEVIK
jgi:SPP1 family predicted phage head-tail adaptor